MWTGIHGRDVPVTGAIICRSGGKACQQKDCRPKRVGRVGARSEESASIFDNEKLRGRRLTRQIPCGLRGRARRDRLAGENHRRIYQAESGCFKNQVVAWGMVLVSPHYLRRLRGSRGFSVSNQQSSLAAVITLVAYTLSRLALLTAAEYGLETQNIRSRNFARQGGFSFSISMEAPCALLSSLALSVQRAEAGPVKESVPKEGRVIDNSWPFLPLFEP